MKGTQFRVRDESGRDAASILSDLSASRGLGSPPESIEEIMDVWSQSQGANEADFGPTELYGDMATNKGWVRRGKQDVWPLAAEKLAAAAEQILVGRIEPDWKVGEEVTCLGRVCKEYSGFLKGEERGVRFKTAVTQIISGPYVFSSIVRDLSNEDHYYSREIVALDEGVTTEEDLMPAQH